MNEPVEILRSAPAPRTEGAHSCGCGEHDADVPVLDVRTIPHAVRHGVVFGAVDQIGPGGQLVLIAPHAPIPLLNQLAQRAPIKAEYLVEGPEEWRILITRANA